MRIETNGIRLNCRIDGPEGAPWLCLSHGLATDLTLWDALVPLLAGRFRILRYDARGHGQSDAPDGDYLFPTLCADVVGLFDALQIERAHFLGVSLGGMVGMGLALDHGDRIDRLVVCDARAVATQAYREAWSERLGDIARGGMEAVVPGSLSRWLTATTLASDPALACKLAQMIKRTPAEGFRGSAAALISLDYERRLGDITRPCLFLTGDQDVAAPPSVVEPLHRLVPGARFVTIADAGHLPVIERPEAVADAVIPFLSA